MLRRSLAFSLLLVAIALTATSTSADRHYPSWGQDRPTEPSDNLLINPDFEGNYRKCADPYNPGAGPQDQLKLPEGWYPWYDNVPVCSPADPGCNPDSYNRRPEWKRWDENDYPGPLRARSRPASQMMFNWSATHTAGFYQQASVPPGSWVTFSIWVQVWSNLIDDPHESTLPGDYVVSVGLDPTGGTDWRSQDIIWSDPVTHYDEFIQLSVTAQAIGHTVTVFTRGAPVWPVKHNDSYWDDACLVVSGTPTPSPTSTTTPSPTPTCTPTPQGMPVPTCETWGIYWEDIFDDADLPGWEVNLAGGSATITNSALRLEAKPGYTNRFPLLWRNDAFPPVDELDLRIRFRHTGLTAYGTSIGVGSVPYDGHRYWQCDPSPSGVRDILYIHHSQSEFFIRPLGRNDLKWMGSLSDEGWHEVHLRLVGSTYTLAVDGTEIASITSPLRPVSLYLGNPVVVENWGEWSAMGIDDLRVSRCASWHRSWMRFPLIFKGWTSPRATPTPSAEPTIPTGVPPSATPEPTIPPPTQE